MFFKKPWKIRDSSDLNYYKLGDSPDSRRNRADSIEFEIVKNRGLVITIIIGAVGLFLALVNIIK